MGAVQSNGHPEPEGAPTDPARREATPDSPSAAQAVPDPAAVADPPAADPPAAAPVDAGSVAAAPAPAPQYEPAAHQPGGPGVPTYPPSWNGAPAVGEAVPPPVAPAWPAAQYPPGPVPFPPPPGWPPPAPYAGTAPSYPPGPYPPTGPYTAPFTGPYPAPPAGPYPAPPTGPYPAPSIGRAPAGGGSWGAPAPARTHRWGLGAYLLAEAVFLLVGVLIGISAGFTGAEPGVGVLILGLAAPTLLAAGTAILITKVRGNGPRIDLNLEWSWRDVGLGLAFGFGGLALTIPASMVFVSIVGPEASSAVGDALGGLRAGPALAVLVLLIVVLVAPMCEEILYRGLLWGGVERLAGRWVAFGVTTLLFALAHFELTRAPLLLVVAIPIAIARLYTGRLLPSIVAHQVNNLLPGVVLMLGLLGVAPMA